LPRGLQFSAQARDLGSRLGRGLARHKGRSHFWYTLAEPLCRKPSPQLMVTSGAGRPNR
jgi:hypothetical protein